MQVHSIATGRGMMHLPAPALLKRCGISGWLHDFSYGNTCLLPMGPGNFDGADMLTFAVQLTGSNH